MILRDVTVFDGTAVVEESAVQFDPETGRIDAVGDVSPSADEPVVSLPDATVTPGLVDAHVHFSLSGERESAVVADYDEPALVLREAGNAHTTLRAGITGVRVMGARGLDCYLRDAIDAGHVDGPRMVASAHSLTITGGHGHHMGVEVDGVDACRQAVRREVKAGADFIKFMATGGITTAGSDPNRTAFTPPEVEAIIDEAHRQGVHVATHAHGPDGARIAAEYGVDTVEHGTLLDDDAIDAMVDNDVTLVPTLSAPFHIVRNGMDVSAETAEQTSHVFDRHIESFKRAVDAGITVAGGTDAGTPFNYHGANSSELEYMVEHGLSVLDAVTAMTKTAAETIGLDDAGVVEPGRFADLLVLDQDPREDVRAFRDPVAVLKGGEVVGGSL